MNIFKLISSLFSPAAELIDSLHTSADERLRAKAVLLQIQTEVINRTIEYESRLLDAQSSIIVAEAQSDSWLTRSWRPITMLTFVVLIVLSFFTAVPIPDDLWFVIKLGLGGYVGGRSLEKTVPAVVNALKQREET